MFPDQNFVIQLIYLIFNIFFLPGNFYRSFGAFPDKPFPGIFIAQFINPVLLHFKPEKIGHQGAKRTNDYARFTGNAQINRTGDYSVTLFFESFGWANCHAGGICAFPAGKTENGQFAQCFQPPGTNAGIKDSFRRRLSVVNP
jgi:hypothetical protein